MLGRKHFSSLHTLRRNGTHLTITVDETVPTYLRFATISLASVTASPSGEFPQADTSTM